MDAVQKIVPGLTQLGAVGADALDHERRHRATESLVGAELRLHRRQMMWIVTLGAIANQLGGISALLHLLGLS